jgi:hypothetical protein
VSTFKGREYLPSLVPHSGFVERKETQRVARFRRFVPPEKDLTRKSDAKDYKVSFGDAVALFGEP